MNFFTRGKPDDKVKQAPNTPPDREHEAVAIDRRAALGRIFGLTAGIAATALALTPSDSEAKEEKFDEDVAKAKAATEAKPPNPEVAQAALEGGVIQADDDSDTRNAYFYGISVLQGLGIAVDVAVATLAMYRSFYNNPKGQAAWILGVGLSHIILPVISGGLTAGGEKVGGEFGVADVTQRGLSAASFVIMAKFLYRQMTKDPNETGPDVLGALDQSFLKYLAAIWAVSVDALLTGPSKWEQARLEGWKGKNLSISVGIGGLTVMLVASLALLGANSISKKHEGKTASEFESSLGNAETPLLFAEALALNYFGVNALVNGTFKAGFHPLAIAALDLAFTSALQGAANNATR